MVSPEAAAALTRTEVRFRSGETECAGVYIRPDTTETLPCVVLAHGFGALKEGGPIRSAERFAETGIAGFAFDYRYFGESGGEPRQLIDPKRQLADWRAAIAFARTLEGVDPERLALWGSSFSGGHVLVLAAEDRGIKAVVSQVPHIDGIKTLQRLGPERVARLTVAGLRDARGRRARPRAPPHSDRGPARDDRWDDHARRRAWIPSALRRGLRMARGRSRRG